MTIDEAIKHAEEEAEEQDKLCKRYDDASGYTRNYNEKIRTSAAKQCEKCAEEHRQLAGWLKELKQLREATRWIPLVLDLLEQTEWIPVSERLPEDGTWNIFTDGKNVSVERYKSDAIDHFFPEGRWFSFENVIAWMPLPDPYKESENKNEHQSHKCR